MDAVCHKGEWHKTPFCIGKRKAGSRLRLRLFFHFLVKTSGASFGPSSSSLNVSVFPSLLIL